MTAKSTDKPSCSLCRRLLCNMGEGPHLRVIFIPIDKRDHQLPDHDSIPKIVCYGCARGMLRDLPIGKGAK